MKIQNLESDIDRYVLGDGTRNIWGAMGWRALHRPDWARASLNDVHTDGVEVGGVRATWREHLASGGVRVSWVEVYDADGVAWLFRWGDGTQELGRDWSTAEYDADTVCAICWTLTHGVTRVIR